MTRPKQVIIGILCSTIVCASVSFVARAQTAERPALSQRHIETIQANCENALVTLRRLHQSDALLRVNQGQLYEYISTRLMARLNSRIALNRLDGAALVAAAARYEETLQQFRDEYQRYEEQLSEVLDMNCRQEPERFYYAITDARQARLLVSEEVKELHSSIDLYKQALAEFRTTNDFSSQPRPSEGGEQ